MDGDTHMLDAAEAIDVQATVTKESFDFDA